MKVVIDTNTLLVSISSKSRYYPIYKSFILGKFDLILTTDILLEYEEIIGQEMGNGVAENILEFLTLSKYSKRIIRYYYWNLIKNDPDDNKFVDAAIAGQADFLISDDAHFRILKKIQFPSVNLLTTEEFFKLVQGF